MSQKEPLFVLFRGVSALKVPLQTHIYPQSASLWLFSQSASFDAFWDHFCPKSASFCPFGVFLPPKVPLLLLFGEFLSQKCLLLDTYVLKGPLFVSFVAVLPQKCLSVDCSAPKCPFLVLLLDTSAPKVPLLGHFYPQNGLFWWFFCGCSALKGPFF